MIAKRVIVKCAGFLKDYWREIAYYACIMLVLGVIAWGAENYRAGRDKVPDTPLQVSAEAANVQDEIRFSIPQGMLVHREFRQDPVWNDALDCWHAHPAVDFTCADGNVYAFGEGEVKTVGESGVCGGFIEIEGGGYLLRYCSVIPCIQVGDAVKGGDLIGYADDGMPGEAYMGAHVHVEAFCEGEMMDVMLFAQMND